MLRPAAHPLGVSWGNRSRGRKRIVKLDIVSFEQAHPEPVVRLSLRRRVARAFSTPCRTPLNRLSSQRSIQTGRSRSGKRLSRPVRHSTTKRGSRSSEKTSPGSWMWFAATRYSARYTWWLLTPRINTRASSVAGPARSSEFIARENQQAAAAMVETGGDPPHEPARRTDGGSGLRRFRGSTLLQKAVNLGAKPSQPAD